VSESLAGNVLPVSFVLRKNYSGSRYKWDYILQKKDCFYMLFVNMTCKWEMGLFFALLFQPSE